MALGWHPCLRFAPQITFQPEGQAHRVRVHTLISGPRELWVGHGRAFRDEALDGTLIVLQSYGQAQPWVLLTDTPVAQTEPTLYACRNWIEQRFRGMKTVGWKCHKIAAGTRSAWADTGWCWRLPPCWPWPTARAGRLWRRAAGPRLPHAHAPGGPGRHLNLPAPKARDPHRTPPSLSLHTPATLAALALSTTRRPYRPCGRSGAGPTSNCRSQALPPCLAPPHTGWAYRSTRHNRFSPRKCPCQGGPVGACCTPTVMRSPGCC